MVMMMMMANLQVDLTSPSLPLPLQTRAGREARAMEVVNAILADMNTHASSSSPTTPMSPEDFEDVSGNLDHEDRFDMQPSSMMERIAE